jgi:hypothetical protein
MPARYHGVFHRLTLRIGNASQRVARISSRRWRPDLGAPNAHQARPFLDEVCQIDVRTAENASSEFSQVSREIDHIKVIGS